MRTRNFRVALALVLGLFSASAFSASYNIDREHSAIMFRAVHQGFGHTWGTFKDFEGSYDFDAKDLSKAKFNVSIKTGSIDTFVAKRDDHLKSPDFFNAKQFPSITFKSTGVKGSDASFEIAGDLTLNGTTKPVVIKATKVGEGKDKKGNLRHGWDGTMTIKRSEFNMKYGLPEAISDEVVINVSIEGVGK